MSNRIYVKDPKDGLYSYSPYIQLIVFPYKRHDTKNIAYSDFKNITAIDDPIYIISDVVNMSISKSKNSPSGAMSVTLTSGDINYEEAIYPGDWIMAYIRREEIIDSPTIDINSGFKFLGYVTDVFRDEQTAANGATTVRYQVDATEWSGVFNSNIYFSPATLLNSQRSGELAGLLYTFAGVIDVKNFTKELTSPQQQVNNLIDYFIGSDPKEFTTTVAEQSIVKQPTRSFVIPQELARIFRPTEIDKSIKKTLGIANIIGRWYGVQKYNQTSLIPAFKPLKGNKIFKVDIGSMSTVWSFMEMFSHNILNEMYCELLPDINNPSKLRPTLVLRQIPFTTNEFRSDNSSAVTRYDEIPRIVIPKQAIISKRIGRTLNTIFNFIQLFGEPSDLNPNVKTGSIALQTLKNNVAFDSAAIARYGLRPMVKVDDFDNPTVNGVGEYLSPGWVRYLGDWWNELHHHFTGSITTVGIQEHLALGYNVQIEDKLFHVEGYSHSFSVQSNGAKSFRTTLQVSMGRSILKSGKSIVNVKGDSNPDYSLDAQSASNINRDDRGLIDEQDRPAKKKK